ncbi:TonB-dependent receptor domain-containing protein [Neolewinella persica]|uniref:TonB-dependent receptor domain-containing protein n=1 Tax=Neolewinella persica TaxID=70998 RepID=UPI0003A81909|nr:TonB-dependent receptor [Neolewinella persica]
MAWLGVRDSLLQEAPRTNGNSENERDNFTTTLAKVQYTYLASSALRLSSSLYYGYQDGNYDFDLNNFVGADIGAGLLNYAFVYHNLGLLTNLAYEQNDWELRTGFHLQDYRRRHLGSQEGIGGLYVNTGKKREFSGFTSLARQTGKLHLRAAAQLRHSSFGYEGSVGLEPLNFTFLNYNLAATLSAGTSQLYYRFGSVGREPTRNDIFGGEDDLLLGGDGPLIYVTEPETVFDHELGLQGNTTSFDYRVNAFYLRFRNEIVLSGAFGPNGLPLRSSVARSYRAGLEWQLSYRLSPALEVHQSGALSDNKITQDDTIFDPVLSPGILLNQGITYRRNAWSFGLDLRHQGASFIDLANENEIAGFTTIDARVSWAKGRWSVSGFAFNLTDESYATNGQLDIYGRPTFHRRAGVNGWMSVTYRW